jgi:eukaryotic-like serine/threonine-protein kinase
MSQIGRYEIVRKTGNHGLDALYEAFDPVMKRTVTIRMPDRTTDPGLAPASQAPAFDLRQIAELDHPNIVKILALEEADDVPFLVLEQAEGTALVQILAGGKNLPEDRVIALLKCASSALDHVHAKGLVHGHLSTECLLFSEDGFLKVCGFEVARPADTFHSNSNGTHPEALMNAVPYMSPELLQGDRVDGRADQFSLACVALQAMTGALPFLADSPVARMRQILFETPRFGSPLTDKFPPAVGKVLERALAKAPAARFSSCAEFVSALEIAFIARPVSAPTRFVSTAPSPAAYSAGPFGARPLGLWFVAAAAAVILVMVISFFVFRSHPVKTQKPAAPPAVVQTPVIPAPPPRVVPTVKPPVAVVKSTPAPAKKSVRREVVPEPEPETKVKPMEPTVPKP